MNMDIDDIKNEVSRLQSEIERIELTFPPNSASILIKDINKQLDDLYAEICPF